MAEASTVVVAGGAGFIGSHLCDRLIERGDRVVVLDNCCTGRYGNVEHLDDSEAFVFVPGDVVDPGAIAAVEHAAAGGVISAVLHLASPASPPEYLRRPLETLDAGSTGTRHLLELAERHDARFLLASTSEVYGDPLVHPQTEQYWGNVNPIGPRSVYDEAKRFSESLTVAFHRARGVDTRTARIFNTYGPRMRAADGRVITNFIDQALRGDPITIYGDGEQTRSFCFVDDEVDGLVALLDEPVHADVSLPVNIGNPGEYTVQEVAALVVELVGSSSSVVNRPLPEDDPRFRRPDISLAAERLGWSPTVDLSDGLRRTIDWFTDASVPNAERPAGAPG
ncbi:dTDP-glucose 4,6-dehydratase [Ilumatobacter fluminis]|uniref:UDP-glucuronate decarboxylase n=1 Tax=Ilumatobacter fluminis TaxID=467091 RepID=A0A4R7HXX6_9ACTN|nr:UDP-glucuronic acid decarboxylase family protein [Ilumatobacter fluminis]TDT15600.1 dTDP-glucose 4,6-dehydratase [Ilumatobacter fluminis]